MNELDQLVESLSHYFRLMEDSNAGSLILNIGKDRMLVLVQGEEEVARLRPQIEAITDKEAGIE